MNRRFRRAKKHDYKLVYRPKGPPLRVRIASTAAFTMLSSTTTLSAIVYPWSEAVACSLVVSGAETGPCVYGDVDVTIQSGGGVTFAGSGNAVEFNTSYSHTFSNAGTVAATGSTGDIHGLLVNGNLTGSITNTNALSVTLTNTNHSAHAMEIMGVITGSVVNSGTINVSVTGITNNGYAYGLQAYDVDGSFTNSGTISLHASGAGAMSVYGLYLFNSESSGSITNSGSIVMTVNNTGTRWASAYGFTLFTELSGTLTNSGNITGTVTGNATADFSGIELGGNVTGTVVNSGNITGNVTGTDGYAHGIFALNDVSGNITNSGNITLVHTGNDSELTGIKVNGYVTGTVVNSGTMSITGVGTTVNAKGININDDMDGAITNTGNITVSAGSGTNSDAYGIRVQLNAGGDITNDGSMTVSGRSAFGIYVGGDADGNITNNGNITVSATYNNAFDPYAQAIGINGAIGGHLLNEGNITVTSNNNIGRAYISAVFFDSVEVNASFINNGNITATANGETAAEVYGIISNPIDGTFINNGSIAVVANGGDVSAYGNINSQINGIAINNGTVSVTTTATGTAAVYGYFFNHHVTGTMTNTGSITATHNGGTQATVWGVDVDHNVTGNLTNSGTITATATNSGDAKVHGLRIGDDLSGTLANSGTITAGANVDDRATVYGIYIGQDVSGSITNTGSIVTTTTNASSATAYGISIEGNVTGSIINNGSITMIGQGTNAYGTGIANNNSSVLSGSLINNGSIIATMEGDSVNARGIAIWDVSGSLINNGSIILTSNATDYAGVVGINTWTTGNLDGVVANTGTMTLSADGGSGYVEAHGIVIGGTITDSVANSGTLTLTANGGTQINVFGFYLNNGVTTGTVTNSGTITATGNGGTNVRVYGIYARSNGSGAMNGTIVNSGTVTANATNPEEAYSVYIEDASSTGNVMNSGTLIGNIGLAGTASLNNSGIVQLPAQANGVSIASIGGGYTQTGSSSILGFGVASNAEYAQLSVTGTANLSSGNTLRVKLESGNTYAGGTLSNVLAAGTLTGPNSYTVKDNTLAYNFTGAKSGNAINIAPTATGLTTLAAATSGSGSGAALVLDTLLADTPASMQSGIDSIASSANASEASTAVSQAMPLLSGNTDNVIKDSMHAVNRVIQARQSANSGFSSGEAITRVDRYFWLKPFGSWSHQGNRGGATGYSGGAGGIVAGGDKAISDKARLGAAVAYSQSHIDSNNDAAPQKLRIQGWQGIVYGSRDLGSRVELNAQADVGRNHHKGRRYVGFAGTNAYADYDSWSVHLGSGVQRSYAMKGNTTFIPSLRADLTHVASESYRETGAGAWNNHVDGSNAQELIFSVDGKVMKPVTSYLTASANAGVGYDVLSDRASVTSSFAGGGPAFVTPGIDAAPWLGRAGIGLTLTNLKPVEATVRYDLETREDYLSQTASLKVRVGF